MSRGYSVSDIDDKTINEVEELVGVDWADVGKSAFGVLHIAGKTVATAFGGGALADAAENLESPILPDWAKGVGTAPTTVSSPDFVVIVHKNPKSPADVINNVSLVSIVGKRFDGNGYKPGDTSGKTFSFGYDSPSKIEITAKGQKVQVTDVKQVLFGGGTETVPPPPAPITAAAKGSGGGAAGAGSAGKSGSQGMPSMLSAATSATTKVNGVERSSDMDIQVLGEQILDDLDRVDGSDETEANAGRSQRHHRHAHVHGDEILGVDDPVRKGMKSTYLCGTDVIGAIQASMRGPIVAPRLGFQVKKTANGRSFTAMRLTKPRSGDHKTSIKNARDAGKRALSIGQKLQAVLKKTAKQAVHGDWNSMLPGIANAAAANVDGGDYADGYSDGSAGRSQRYMAGGNSSEYERGYRQGASGAQPRQILGASDSWTEIVGEDDLVGSNEWTEIVGAALSGSRPHMNLLQMQKAAADSIKFGKDALAHADKHEKYINGVAARQKAAAKRVAAAMNMGTRTGTMAPGGGNAPTPPPAKKTAKGKPVAKPVAIHPITVHGLDDEMDDFPGEDHIYGDLELDAQIYGDHLAAVCGLAMPAGYTGYGSTGTSYQQGVPGAVDPTTGLPYAQTGIDPTTGLPYSSAYPASTGMYPVDPNNPPDPNNPGYLMNGMPDMNYQSTGATLDPSMDPSQNYGLGPPPTVAPPLQAGVDFDPYPGDDTAFVNPYSSSATPSIPGAIPTPVGLVYYDGSRPMPWQGVGSLTRFHYNLGDQTDGHYDSGYQWGGGDPSIMDGWYWWWHGATHGTEYKHDEPGGATNGESILDRTNNSIQRNWGPLVGNPGGSTPWTSGLLLDVDGTGVSAASGSDQSASSGLGAWFWYRDKAPAWATAADDMARLNQAVLDYKAAYAAAAAAAAQQAAQDKLDQQQAAAMAKQQALEDAQAQHQSDLASIQADSQAQQADLASYQAQAQQEQLDVQERQQALDYYKAHPEQLYAAQDQGGGGGGRGGGDNGGDAGDDGVDWGAMQEDGDRNAVPSDDGSDASVDDLENDIDS